MADGGYGRASGVLARAVGLTIAATGALAVTPGTHAGGTAGASGAARSEARVQRPLRGVEPLQAARITLVPPDAVIDAPPRPDPPDALDPLDGLDAAPWPMPKILRLDRATAARGASETAARSNAVPFAPDGRPLLAVVLVDEMGLVDAKLDALPSDFALTVAVDPTAPDVAERARRHRDAGREVILSRAIGPEGPATPQEIEVAVAGALRAVDGAVGVLLGAGRGAVADRAIADALARTGHAVLTPPGRFGPRSAARRAGLPVGEAWRVLDAGDQAVGAIAMTLDRAVLEAVRGGGVTLIGMLRPGTVAALRRWAEDGRYADVQTAPLTARMGVTSAAAAVR